MNTIIVSGLIGIIALLIIYILLLQKSITVYLNYIMAQKDIDAYKVSHPPKQQKKTREEIKANKEKAHETECASEWSEIMRNGVIDDAQIKKFGGEKEAIIT